MMNQFAAPLPFLDVLVLQEYTLLGIFYVRISRATSMDIVPV